jgi:hypothetical protein
LRSSAGHGRELAGARLFLLPRASRLAHQCSSRADAAGFALIERNLLYLIGSPGPFRRGRLPARQLLARERGRARGRAEQIASDRRRRTRVLQLQHLLGTQAASPAGRITIRGPLLVRSDPEARDERLEGERCHLVDPAPIVVGASVAASIRLDGLVCRGDQSRRCCTIPAYGQTVVARGQPERDGGSWVLRGPDLCVAR